MSRFGRILAGAAVCLMCLAGGSAMAASGQHEVTASKLFFRDQPSADGALLGRLTRGTVVTVLSTDDGWAKLRWDGQVGYASEEYLKKITASSEAGSNTTQLSGTARLTTGCAMYQAADDDSARVCTLSKGAEVSLRGETMNFYYVKADGKTGYVLKKNVTLETGAKAGGSAQTAQSAEAAQTQTSSVLKVGCTGEAVKALQKRLSDLGYLDERYITGYYGDLTFKAVKAFQNRAGLEADGVYGPASRKAIESGSAPKKLTTVEMNWFETNVSSLVAKRGGTAYIIDCATGVKIKIRRVGGSNHMDVEPASAADTEKLSKIYGGTWSWDQRAVVLLAGGKQIAASINGMPHGDSTTPDNNFDGHFCLHTTGSKTHGTDQVNQYHQVQVEAALKYR